MKKHISCGSIHVPTTNVFEVPEPHTVACRVWQYRASHSLLVLAATKPSQTQRIEPDFYISFANVQYFEGPMSWVGADFRLGQNSECLKLLQESGMVENMSPELASLFSKTACLFIVKTKNMSVRLIAESASSSSDLLDKT